ncbi:serine hydrolase [uncultured Sphingomonas sp.]|uniref:serine hydrolase n=1 Tax=uncultured Sphingomonas sp. TaxID=158754 RepID=UPI0035CA889C
MRNAMRFAPLLAWLVAIAVQPALAEAPPSLRSLEERLASMARENPGEYGIAALDLATGETVSFNGHQAFPMASTMKIAVAAAYLSEVDAGRRTLDEAVSGVPASTLMDAMITRSDNRATDLLMGTLGGPQSIDAWLRARSLAGMRVDRTIAQLLSDRRDLRDVRDSSTPVAMLGLLRLIDTNDALKPESRRLLLGLMARCATGSNRIRGILPPGATVEHKTGTLSGYTGDVGYLTTPAGRRIAVVLFARGGSNRPAIIATAARAIYDAFQAGSQQASAYSKPQGARPLGIAAPIHSSTATDLSRQAASPVPVAIE